MIYTIDDICRDVRVAIDENSTSEALTILLDSETLSLDEIIESKAVEAVTRVHSVAPLHMLQLGHHFGDTVYWNGDDTCGWALLPDDFMRLLVFMMDDWDKPVYEAIDAQDTASDTQYSHIEGIRGTPQRPKCVLAIRPEGRVLEFYTCKSQQAQVSRAVYVPRPDFNTVEHERGVEVSDKCREAVIYTIASLVMSAYGETEKSKMFDNLATSLLK